jgi:hypothetical protein
MFFFCSDMSSPDPSSFATDESDTLDNWERALLDRQLEALGRLADMGMAMAAAITGRATAEEPGSGADLNHAAMDFARVSRAVRMTFALQSRLIAEFKGGGVGRGAAGEPDDGPIDVFWRDDIVDHEVVQKRQVRGIVERLAEAASLDGEAVERLVCEAGERLEDDRLYRDLATRPLGEIVALVCKDLGLEPDWALIADDYWAKAEIDRSARGSPYAGWKARQAPELSPPLVPSG